MRDGLPQTHSCNFRYGTTSADLQPRQICTISGMRIRPGLACHVIIQLTMTHTRRDWLFTSLAMASWPEVLSAQEHARGAAKSGSSHFESLDVASAAEIEAIAAQVIPSTEAPGAREAGIIYFIDRALATFARDRRDAYRAGMAELQQKRRELFPQSDTIRSLTDEQQIALIRSAEQTEFFELLRTHTVLGFLGNPSYGGNRERIGWRQIGFEGRMAYQPPFGYYDAEASAETLHRGPNGEEKP